MLWGVGVVHYEVLGVEVAGAGYCSGGGTLSYLSIIRHAREQIKYSISLQYDPHCLY